MAPYPVPGWQIYKEQMASWRHGDALWQPAPTHNYQRIRIGDVGFIRWGQFHLLFSAGLPREEQPEIEVPDTFEEMQPGAIVATFSQPRPPGCLLTDTVREFGVGIGASASTFLPLEPGASFSFELTGKHGAALVTKHQTYKQDALKRAAFEQYTKKHYESWVAFSHEKQYGNDVKPVLVSGIDMTKDFAMAAYSNEGASVAADLTISVPMLASTSASIWGTWRTSGLAHTNYGPQQCAPPSFAQASDRSLQPSTAGPISDDYNQVMKGGAGPHDLGPGQNHDSTFPELAARPDRARELEHDIIGDHETRDSASGEDDSEPNVVVHNLPDGEEYDEFDAIADYIFQNSNATSVLMHHQDIADIRAVGGVGDISSLLAENRPRIVVDESGVGKIMHEGIQPLGLPASLPRTTTAFEGTRSSDDVEPSMPGPVATTSRTSDEGIPLLPPSPSLGPSQHANLSPDPLTIVNPDERALRYLLSSAVPQDELPSLIETIFSGNQATEAIDSLGGGDAQVFIDIIDKALDCLDLAPHIRGECMRLLYEMCARHYLLPESLNIGLCYNPADAAHCRGGFADVWKGEHRGVEVAVKVLRTYTNSDLEKVTRRFCKEFVAWKALHHQNVLPLLGVIMTENRFAMVSEWMPNGNINQFVEMHWDVNRFELLGDVARGLIYMHGRGMVHGDLKGANILVDQTCHARLADFGLLTIISDSTSDPWTQGGTTRWMGPEFFDPEIREHHQTKHSDCYALGMVIYEVLSGRVPFYQYENSIIPGKVFGGDRPERPRGAEGVCFTDDVWEVLRRCWTHQPGNRPNVEGVLQYLKMVSKSWTPPSPRSPAVSLTTGSPTRETSGIFTMGNTDGSLVSSSSSSSRLAPSQPSETPDPEGSTEIVGGTSHDHLATPTELVEHIPRVVDDASEERRILQAVQQSGVPALPTHQPAAASAPLMKIANWDGKSRIDQALIAAFEAMDYLDCIKNLRARQIEPQLYINSLGGIIDSLPADSGLRRRCIRALRKTCGLYGILPASYVVTTKFSKPPSRAFASGGFSDVWRLTDEEDHDRVFAVKSLRVYEADPIEKINKKYCKEVIVSKLAKHPNILSIEGVAPELFEFCMVSQWMVNGNMQAYVAKHPGVNRLELLVGITRGLGYLHRNEMVHGGLKSSNILIDAKGNPRLSDFSLSSVTKNIDSANCSTPTHGSAVRYCAPELLGATVMKVGKAKPTNKSDVYSLSMVIVELATGRVPFPEYFDSRVFVLVEKGKRPSKPRRFETPGITPAVWKIAERCWHEKAGKRPEANIVLQYLENLVNSDGGGVAKPLIQRWREVFKS